MKKVYVEEGGAISVREVPEPVLRPRWYLTDTQYSLISAGTEAMHIRTMASPESRGKGPRRIGYSNSGIVRLAGDGAVKFKPGELIGCYGAGFADHQSVCAIPETLAARCRPNVTARQAAFVGVGTFGLNGLRLCNLSFGEVVAAIGLGLIGQLTVQIARAAGYRVVGITHSESLAKLAIRLGAADCVIGGRSDTVKRAIQLAVDLGGAPPAAGRAGGFDAAVICSGNSQSNEALLLALEIIRDSGVISVVGGVKLDFPRAPFFERQARLVIARAAGVGRYDPVHEEQCQEIPHSHVRWTEGRNCEEVLRIIGEGRLNVDALITHEFPVERAAEAYDLILNRPKDCLAVLLSYRI
ncbi:MAG: zinc-dependent alcohol dehydrogenase [Kiritimatiellia bacterium]